MESSENIEFGVRFRDTTLNLSLRLISVLEDTEYQQRFTQIADKKGEARAAAEYKIYADALAAWAAEMPTTSNGKTNEKGEPVITPIAKAGEVADAVKAYFAEKTPAKEWIAVTAVSTYRGELFPSVIFPKLSA